MLQIDLIHHELDERDFFQAQLTGEYEAVAYQEPDESGELRWILAYETGQHHATRIIVTSDECGEPVYKLEVE